MSITTAPATIRLIGIGNVPAVPLSEVKAGDRIAWNYGQTYTVVRNTKVAANTYELVERDEDGREWTRRKRGTKLVARRPGIEQAPAAVDVTLTWPATDAERDELRGRYLAAATSEERRTAAMALGGDVPLGCPDCGARQFVDSSAEEEAWWAVHGGADESCTADVQDTPAKTEQLATAHTPRKIGPKQWAIECTWGCGNTITTTRKPPAMLGCSRPACHAAHNASVTARQAEKAARPRAPRVRREIPASDWNMLVAFSRPRSTRPTADPRTVTGTPENIDARTTARARGERASQTALTFDESDRQAMTLAQLRAVPAGALALF